MKPLYEFCKKITRPLCLLALLSLSVPPSAQAQFTQLQKLTPRAAQRQADAVFGTSVALDGNLMVVGAPGDRNGGAVYVYERSGDTWNQIDRLIPSDRAPEDDFGCSVSVSGNTIVVGNNREYEPTSSNPKFNAGAAYIFEKREGAWQQTQKLTASIRNAFDEFGTSVSVSGNTLVVGIPGQDFLVSNNPNPVNNAGAVYVYEKSGDSWQQTQQLRAGSLVAGDEFGYSISLSGSTLVVGALDPFDDSNGSNPLDGVGSAYVFEKGEDSWQQTQQLRADEGATGDYFGYSVSVSDNTLVVGAVFEGDDPNGSNPVFGAGAAYVFEKREGTWQQTQKLTAPDRDSYDEFGGSVSVSGTTLVVGAKENKEDEDNPGTPDGVGSAYVFQKREATWQQNQKLSASDYAFRDFFGHSVCVLGSTLVVGATQEDEDANGSNSLNDAGSAYVFGIPCLAPTAFTLTGGGSFCAGGSGVAIGLSGSETGVTYQLKNGDDPVGEAVPGTGAALQFGPFTTAGTYTVVASRSGSCPTPMTGSVTVTVKALPDVSFTDLASSFCKNAATVTLTGNPAGGSFTIDGTAATTFDPATLAVGERVVVYTYTDGNSCSNSASQTVTVKALPSVSIAGLASSFCKNAAAVTLTGSPAGGSFTIDGNPATTFDPATLAAGQRVVVYTYTDPTTTCTNSASQTVTVGQPEFSSPASVSGGTVCAGTLVLLSFAVNCLDNASFGAELTDTMGQSLGIPLGNVSPGSQSLTLPAGTPTGSYKIRITGGNPAISSLSNAFGVTGLSANFNSTATVSQVPACAGAGIRVSFTQASNPACSFPLGNGFTAQLSDAAGSFASPLTLGTVSPGINSVTIPQNTPAGSGYRVRIAATAGPEYSGAVYSAPSVAFTVNAPGFASTPTVSADNKCPGEAVRVSFSMNGCAFPAGNAFRVQLSNASGSFENPLTLPGTVSPGSLNNVTIPAGTPAGTSYKLRIVSSNPEAMSAASGTFKVKACGNPREAAPNPEYVGLRVAVSPNPSPEGRLRIAVTGAEGQALRVDLVSATGQLVREQAVEKAGETEVLDWDVSRQPAGLYLLRVSGERESKTLKVLH